MRVGIGHDVHKMVKGRALILGGVIIPYEKGLLGHSDADVLAHAIMDALLGAAGEGDIGKHFPDSDMKYKGISSLVLLARVKELLHAGGFEILNVDSVIVAQEPKIAPHIKKIIPTEKTASLHPRNPHVKAALQFLALRPKSFPE